MSGTLLLLLLWVHQASNRHPAVETTAGPIPVETLGLILPHEHIFTDLRGPETPDYGQADAEDVVRVMKPLLSEAKARGVDLIVECTTVGVGRNARIIARLAEETGLRIVLPTGVYGRDNFAPRAYREMSQAELTAWMVWEITNGIDGTAVKAGFIKTASTRAGLTALEERYLRASAQAAKRTGVVIASHTGAGSVAVRQADILDEEGLPLHRFIWVHAQSEQDLNFHRQLARRGVYIEFDSLGQPNPGDERMIEIIREMTAAGFAERILLSHDAGWYRPGEPNGGKQRPYTHLVDVFLPKLRAAGFDESTIKTLTIENPCRAFGVLYP